MQMISIEKAASSNKKRFVNTLSRPLPTPFLKYRIKFPVKKICLKFPKT